MAANTQRMDTQRMDAQRLQQALHAAQARGIVPAGATLPEDESPSWVVLVLSFLGAQLVVWPVLLFLGFTVHDFLSEPPGTLVMSAMFLAAGIFMLRVQGKGMFFASLAFNVLLTGIGLWCWALVQLELDDWFFPVLSASLLALIFAIRVQWVQILLGMAFAVVAAHMDMLGLLGVADQQGYRDFPFFSLRPLNMWLLAGAWWAWCALESRCGSKPWVPAVYALMQGLAVGLLLTVLFSASSHLQSAWHAGSADVIGAGAAALFHLNGWTLASCLLVLASGLWLAWRWVYLPAQRDQAHDSAGAGGVARSLTPEHALWLVLYGVWAVLAFVIPHMGVLAVLFTAAWVSGRWRMLVLALLVLLAQLSSFYYALQWPLVHKAGLLVAAGGVLALALGGLHLWGKRMAAAPASAHAKAARADRRGSLAWRASLAASLLLALALTQWDVMQKEQVLAQGQKIYISLVPRDPRSIMQGDYMALNFDLPSHLVQGDEDALQAQAQDRLDPLQGTAWVVARLDDKGIATLQRRYQPNEALAAGEVIVPLKYMKGDWVVVSNAYFFPEGQGRVFSNARYGEFRLLGKGKVLLAGLADEHLQRIEPQPDRADEP